jgi:DNA polymerase
MTAAEKSTAARFLDLAADSLFSGYRGEERGYCFVDDEAPPVKDAAMYASAMQATVMHASMQATAYTAENSQSGGGLERIAAEIRACTLCPLADTRTNTVPGEGANNPLVVVIGEGPGADEDATGRPFVGRAGQLLDKMLGSIGLSRGSNCFIANVVKCRPPNNRDPRPEETAACAHFLEQQIALLAPKFILVAGRIAAQTLLKTGESIGKLRGKITEFETERGAIPLLVTYHPSALLRNEEYKRPAWEDLKLLRSKLESGGEI